MTPIEPAMRDLSEKFTMRPVKWLLAVLAALFLAVWLAPPHHAFEGIAQYQSIHIPVETLSIVVSMLVFGVAWNAYSRERASNIVVLACGLLAVGLIDFAHMLSFAGMPDWVTPSDPEKAINFWLAARFVFAVTLLAVALRPWQPFVHPRSRYMLLAAALGVSALVYWIGLHYQHSLPHTFIAGKGLTPLKVAAEYAIVVLLAASALMFWRQGRLPGRPEANGLFAAAVITILSELSFTLYSGVTDIFNLLGHVYKVAAYVFVYRTIFIGSVHEPFRRVVQAEASLRHANRALKTLSACNHTLVHSDSEAQLLQDMCRVIVEEGGYPLAWVGVAEQDEAKTVRPVAQFPADNGYVQAIHVSWSEEKAEGRGPTGTALRTGQTQVMQDIAGDERMVPWREPALTHGYLSSIALPLQHDTTSLGTLTIYADEANAFDSVEIALLEEMAMDIAFGIVSLQARGELERRRLDHQHELEQTRDSLHDTVQAIAATVEMRDPYTAGHQRRVADLAAGIAGEMGMTHEQIYALHLSGIVHDLGKISIPAEILSKPGRLSAIEYTLVKQHPQAGYDILKEIEFPWPLAQFVLQHHERMDGSGYPQGLKGDEILPEARVLAVADVIEAMASHRPYRAGLGLESALEEINAHRGTLYDPAVVDAALRLFREKHYQFKS
jgi:HD-GYP domain-containing protein (c-di-GMP phosphodiesterase class II)